MSRRRSPFFRRYGLCWQYQQQPEDGVEVIDGQQPTNINVGGNLRRLREERNLTIRELAKKSGLAANTLSLIENGKSSPSVSTLEQLAMALNVTVTAFFETGAPQNNIAYVRAGYRPRATFNHGLLEDLGAGSMIQAVEPFVVTLDANAGNGPQEIVHTGYEFIFCLEGRIAFFIEGHPYVLEPGDSLLFEAHLPHRWQNLSPAKSQSVLVLYPTDKRDDPSERHFIGE